MILAHRLLIVFGATEIFILGLLLLAMHNQSFGKIARKWLLDNWVVSPSSLRQLVRDYYMPDEDAYKFDSSLEGGRSLRIAFPDAQFGWHVFTDGYRTKPRLYRRVRLVVILTNPWIRDEDDRYLLANDMTSAILMERLNEYLPAGPGVLRHFDGIDGIAADVSSAQRIADEI